MPTTLKYEVECSDCAFTGTLRSEEPYVRPPMTITGRVILHGVKCPHCGQEKLSAPGGRYEQNAEGVYERVGDPIQENTK